MNADQTQLVLQLFVRYQPRIKGLILSLLGDFASAEDVVQETFLVVQQKSGEFEPGSNYLAWVFQIARLQVQKHLLQGARTKRRFSDAAIEALASSAPTKDVDDRKSIALAQCVEKLAPQARRIVDLFYRSEHPPQEIAKLMNWTMAAVSVALSRARRSLRECIEQRLRGETS
jgi:RNA polymerase sigma-70 factor (ECF subfamily)